MGLCCSVSTPNDANNSKQNGDESSLINSNQNAITEAMSQDFAVPPAPLLKEINFAAINEEDGNASDSSLNDDDIKEILNEEEEENT